MRLLCVGDIHIKPTNTHLVDILEKYLCDYIDQYNIDITILLGDILDTFERIHTQALNRAYKLIDTLKEKTKVYVIVGNHDYINNQQFMTDNHWMNGLKQWRNVYVVDTVLYTDELFFVPYVPVGKFIEALDSTGKDWKSAKYIFSHQEFRGCKMGAIVSSHGDEWSEDYPQIISGHIHDYQKTQENVLYTGASIPSSFAEQNIPKVLYISDRDEFVELEVLLPRNKTIYLNLEDVKKNKVLDTVKNSEDNYKIVIKDNPDNFKLFANTVEYEELSKHCKIVIKPPKNLGEKKDNIEPEGSFVEVLSNKVLMKNSELLYSIFQEVIYGNIVDYRDILIIPRN